MTYDVVIPTAGRPSLNRLLESLARSEGPAPARVIVADDRPPGGPALAGFPAGLEVEVVRSHARGPAAARNRGWRAARSPWVAFLDDDVLVSRAWRRDLVRDLDAAAGAAGSQGRIRVPLPGDRRPTDWERSVRGLERARWATADMAYRRDVLEAVGGFDERFPRAYREDADLALRVLEAGGRLAAGRRLTLHPVPGAGFWVSLQKQAGNADDVLMHRLHGAGWRHRAGSPAGSRWRHLATAAMGVGAAAAALGGHRRAAAALGGGWAALTAAFAWERIAPGPRTRDEVTRMAATSALITFTAAGHWLTGIVRAEALTARPAAVLFDRDGTLVEDVPYNGTPERVRLRPGAVEAVARLRAAGVPVGVVSNQSGVARGLITAEQVAAVNARADHLLGGLDTWAVCLHGPEDGCGCRKPRPGLVLQAAATLGVHPARCAVIGDIGADVEAAVAAGARGILVPTEVTRPEEVTAAPEVAADLRAAVDRLLGRERVQLGGRRREAVA